MSFDLTGPPSPALRPGRLDPGFSNRIGRRRILFFTAFHFPKDYFDALQGLRVLTKLGYSDDERIRNATRLLLSKRSRNGTWNLEGDEFREGDFFYPGGKGRKASISIEQIGKPSKWILSTAIES